MARQRVRIRFAKQGDLKLIGHRDLVRTLERLFRRCNLQLAMSQGFHPRPLMTFPDALAIGVTATNEVMELALDEVIDPTELADRMNQQCPDGLVILSVQVLNENDRKAKMASSVYELQLSKDTDLVQLAQNIESLAARETLSVKRKEKQVELALKEILERLWIEDDCLKMSIRVATQSQLQPRDLLAELGLLHLVKEGAQLTRTKVELAT